MGGFGSQLVAKAGVGLVERANLAATRPRPGIVTDTDNACPRPRELGENEIKQVGFPLLTVSPDRVSAHVRDLHHAGQLAVHEKRGLHEQSDFLCPARASFMEDSHEVCEAAGHALVVVLHQKSMFGGSLILKESVKTSDNLSESLLERRSPGRPTSKTPLVRAFSEEIAVVPGTNGLCDLPEQFTAFSKR